MVNVEHIIQDGRFYLYRHIRNDKNVPFYIGIGKKNRKQGLYNRAFTSFGRNQIWRGIANRTDIEVEILLETDDIDFVVKKEIEFISLYGKIIENTGSLANMQDGGKYAADKITPIKKGHPEYEKRVERFISLSKERIGKNNFNKLSKKIFVYTLGGDFLYGFDSGVQAADFFGQPNKDIIIRKLDTGRSYKNYFFSSVCAKSIDTSNFTICDEKRHYPKMVAKVDKKGNNVAVYKNLITAANSIGYSPGALGVSIRGDRKSVV